MPALSNTEPEKSLRDIGHLAVWRVSTAKPGNGVDLLRDGRDDTYWQSDGAQPHIVTLEFQRRVVISAIALQTDFKLDESYTPQKISIKVGTSSSDLHEVRAVELHEPQGWMLLPVEKEDKSNEGISAWILQLAVLSNHQNGRDTHIRQLKVYGPRVDPIKALGHDIGFTSPEFNMFASVR